MAGGRNSVQLIGEETDADASSPLVFPWHCDAICPKPLHLKQCISERTLRIQLPSLSWRSWKQSFFLLSLRIFDSEDVRLVEAAANSAGPSLTVITALAWVNSCSTLIVSILDEACSRCLKCCGSPETKAHVNQHSSSGPQTTRLVVVAQQKTRPPSHLGEVVE